MPEGEVELLPVCSCCRMRVLRLTPSTAGRVCPDCDAGAYDPPSPPAPKH